MSSLIASMLRFNAVLMAGSLLLAGQQAANTAKENEDVEDTRKMLVYLWTARDLDAKCHVLKSEERAALNVKIVALLKATKITEEYMKSLTGENPVDGMSCDGKVPRLLFDFARAKPEQKSEEEEDREAWKFVQDSWRHHFKKLPAGTLGAFEGCWTGDLSGVQTEMCLLNKGDLVRFRLGSRAKPYCAFSDGGARKREDIIIFFTPSATGKCADGSAIQHVEGGCKAISETEMECVISVFSHGNTIYEAKDGTSVNGRITLSRSAR